MFFSQFPATLYDGLLVTDVFKRMFFSEGFKRSNAVENYFINEEDTPESLADLLYGDQKYSWLILTINDIHDRHKDWPKKSYVLDEYVKEVYRGSAIFIPDDQLQGITLSSVKKVKKGTVSYTVYRTDRTLNKLEVEEAISEDILQSGSTVQLLDDDDVLIAEITVGRVVYDNRFALHHFEDASGVALDTRGSDDTTIDYESECDSCLEGYINGENETFAVTNLQHELAVNDAKRNIIMIRPETVPAIVAQFKKLMDGVKKDSDLVDLQNTQAGQEISE